MSRPVIPLWPDTPVPEAIDLMRREHITFVGEDLSNILVTCKVADLDQERVRELIAPVVERLVDVRVC
jgi:CBS domain-containing protein